MHKAAGLMLKLLPGQLTCGEFEDFMFAYHEGDLSDRERDVFEFHMEICPMCKTSLDGYRRSIELGQQLFAREEDASAPAPVDPSFVAGILAARESG